MAFSVPADWQEQTPPFHHQPNSDADPNFSNAFFQAQEARAAPMDYCDIFEKVSDVSLQYMCKICGKKVTNRWHHTAIHRPQMNRCPVCQQTFTRRDNMKAHIRMKHGTLVADVLGDSHVDKGVAYL